VTPLPIPEKPEGFQEHHRQKRRSKDERPVNKLWVSADMHKWIEEHPRQAAELGWTVSQQIDPGEVVVTIPDEIMKSPERKPRGPRREKARNRATVQFKVPKDAQEDGAGIIDDRIDILRAVLGPDMGWTSSVPEYQPVADGLAYAIQALRNELGDKEFKRRLREWAKEES